MSKPIRGNGAPTMTTEGAVGQIYIDTDTGIQYRCVEAEKRKTYGVDVANYSWVWRRLNGDFVATDDEVKMLLENAGSGSKLPEKVLFKSTDSEGNTLCCGRKCSEITKEEAYALVLSTMPFVMLNEHTIASSVVLTSTYLAVMTEGATVSACGGEKGYTWSNFAEDIDVSLFK